jgi:hypothetical protein
MAVTLTAKISDLKAAIQTVEFTVTTNIEGQDLSIKESSRFFSPQ